MERNIEYIPNNPKLIGLAETHPDIVYSTATGTELKLTLITPWRTEKDQSTPPRNPLIVFIQGSAWTFPNIHYELPQLASWARAGYVVATVTHRNCLDGHPFPAFLQDVKTAIRFLRSKKDEFGIDPERVCAWGTSSGGNTALLLGTTGDDPAYKTGEYAGESDAVQAVVDCFGPTDLLHFGLFQGNAQDLIDHDMKLFLALAGSIEPNRIIEQLKGMSPLYKVETGVSYPPFLMLHGDSDDVVEYDQSVRMLDRLTECGADARLICVNGAPHEGNFWSCALLEKIRAFIAEKL